MREDLSCLRCGEKMQLIRREFIQLGKAGVFSGDWGNLLAGALDVDILGCPNCGKLEFYRADWNQEPEEEAGSIARSPVLIAAIATIWMTPSVHTVGRRTPGFKERST